ncbi:hypothetical protein JB92DRAFT_2894244 [Gautieria morchelliformis]|nr:hypothetical protein JB92DRAFT_2894244 [Gautieria morchelliformis]
MVNYDRKPLDASLYSIDPRLAKLLKASTGIQDDAQLKAHILRIQKEAYESFPYPCIRLFTFTTVAVTQVPFYNEVIKQGRRRPDALLLEIGVGFGNDVRKVVDDGYPVQNIVVSDINPQLWEIGHRLFRSDSRSFPVKFVQGDIFDERALSTHTQPSPYRPDLRMLRNLTPLTGHVTAISLQMVFHLFDLNRQTILARRLAHILSPSPGSLIVGRQMGSATPREILLHGNPHYVHNAESWERMWSKVYPRGSVEYRSVLQDLPPDIVTAAKDMVTVTQFLNWSIRVL